MEDELYNDNLMDYGSEDTTDYSGGGTNRMSEMQQKLDALRQKRSNPLSEQNINKAKSQVQNKINMGNRNGQNTSGLKKSLDVLNKGSQFPMDKMMDYSPFNPEQAFPGVTKEVEKKMAQPQQKTIEVPQRKKEWWQTAGDVIGGVGKAIGEGAVEAVTHPVKTAKKVGEAVISSEKAAGEALGAGMAGLDPYTRKVREETIQRQLDSSKDLISRAVKEKDPVKKKKYFDMAQQAAKDISSNDIYNDPMFKKDAKQVLASFGGVALDVITAGQGKAATQGIKSFLKSVGKQSTAGFGQSYLTAIQEGKSQEEALKDGVFGAAIGGSFPVSGKATQLAGKGVKAAAKKTLPTVAGFLTGIDKSKYKEVAKMGSEKFNKALEFVDNPENIPEIGKDIAKVAKKLKSEAVSEYGTKQKEVIKQVGPKFQAGLKEIRTKANDLLSNENIKIKNGQLNFADTALTADKEAQDAIKGVYKIIQEKSNRVESLLDKEKALRGILNKIPKGDDNTKRIVGGIINAYKENVSKITGGKSTELAAEYAKKKGPAQKFLMAVTDKDGKFSYDAADRYIKQTMSDVKFDKGKVISEIDKVAGTDFFTTVKNLGVAKALNRLDPVTGSRIKDIVLGLGVAKVPGLAGIVSPKLWASSIAKLGGSNEMAKNMANLTFGTVLKNIAKSSVRKSPGIKEKPEEVIKTEEYTSPEQSLDEIFGGETPTEGGSEQSLDEIFAE